MPHADVAEIADLYLYSKTAKMTTRAAVDSCKRMKNKDITI